MKIKIIIKMVWEGATYYYTAAGEYEKVLEKLKGKMIEMENFLKNWESNIEKNYKYNRETRTKFDHS